MALDLEPCHFRRDEYDRMVAAGVFEDRRVELLHGIIVTMPPNDPAHANPIELWDLGPRARRTRSRACSAPADRGPRFGAGAGSAVVPLGDHRSVHPDRALLVIEVACSSVRRDRVVKGPLYAASGFREYWLFDVAAGTVEVHRGPSTDGWCSIVRHGRDEVLAVEAFPDVSVPVGRVLP